MNTKKIALLCFCFVLLVILVFYLIFYFRSSDVYFNGNFGSNKIALTFDDGPSNQTLEIIKILKEENVSATFFVTGEHILEYPEIFRELVNSSNEIGSHTYHHSFLNFKGLFAVDADIKENFVLLESYGVNSSLFRPPKGWRSFILVNRLNHFGKKVILWNIASNDYKNTGVPPIYNRVMSNVKNGSIIDFHDSAYDIGEVIYTPGALRLIIPELKKNYSLVTISELLNFTKY